MNYNEMNFKIPVEGDNYLADSKYAIEQIESILQSKINGKENRIEINTSLKTGLPMENINKIAGPIIEAWAFEIFNDIKDEFGNKYCLINAETRSRLDKADIFLQFKKGDSVVSAHVDSKSTAEDIPNSGKGPNITSFSRIRTAYVVDPDFLFIILSLKHKVYCQKNPKTMRMDGVMEVVKYNAYDLKLISDNDIIYNSALGTGQIQIKIFTILTIKRGQRGSFANFWTRNISRLPAVQ